VYSGHPMPFQEGIALAQVEMPAEKHSTKSWVLVHKVQRDA
jgi:hypothetical protein